MIDFTLWGKRFSGWWVIVYVFLFCMFLVGIQDKPVETERAFKCCACCKADSGIYGEYICCKNNSCLGK